MANTFHYINESLNHVRMVVSSALIIVQTCLEQAIESSHYDFVKYAWEHRYEINSSHPNYSQRLLRSMCEYNAIHLLS